MIKWNARKLFVCIRYFHVPHQIKDTILAVVCIKETCHEFDAFNFNGRGVYEHVLIKKITDEVSGKLNRPFLKIADYPVGLEGRIRNVLSLIGSDFGNKVNMLGFHGIGGIGKSTLARAIYNLIAEQFDGSCFLANVREKSGRNGLVQIQETMLLDLVGERNIKLEDVNQGIPILKARLHRKKVLLVLDDVDKKDQLDAIAGGFDWFGVGSVIIVTTRNKHL